MADQEKIYIKEAVIVEGLYDKRRLLEFLDGVVYPTDGFSVLQDDSKLELFRKLAEKDGVVILTDSDRAGFKIRNHLKGKLPSGTVKHAYIPEIAGKERRKREASKDGFLGVEGVPQDVILKALRDAGCVMKCAEEGVEAQPSNAVGTNGCTADGAQRSAWNSAVALTKADLYEAGLCGVSGSDQKRRALAAFLGLPQRISANSMLAVLNRLYQKEDFTKMLQEFEKSC